MILSSYAKRVEKLAIDNSPALLTALAVTGTVFTAVLTNKAAFRAARIIEVEQTILDSIVTPATNYGHVTHQLTLREKADLTWKLYVPPAATGAATIACIIGAHQVGSRRTAALAAAYSLSEKAYAEYKAKIVEKLGEKKEQGLRDEISQDRVNRNPVEEREVIILSGDQLCYDSYSGRYFQSNMEAVKKAQNDLNYRIISDNYASLTDFYNLLGLESTSVSDEVGWNVDKLLEISFTSTLATDGRPAICLDYRVEPVRGYFRLH